jgi:uncharacterized protein YjbI with pentapeptide repeats
VYGVIATLLTAVLILWLAVILPSRFLDVRGLSNVERLAAENALRTTLAGVLAGLAVIVGSIVGALNLAHNRRVLDETQRQNQALLELQRRGQVTDRFGKAIEQLGSDSLELRLGAIYGLEQIARDSLELQGPILEILTAFVRQHSQMDLGVKSDERRRQRQEERTEPLRLDFQAVATVLRRRNPDHDGPILWIDLRGAGLHGADLRDAMLNDAQLEGAILDGAILHCVDFEGADLRSASMVGADFSSSRLKNAYLADANLDDSEFCLTNMDQARLPGATLRGARFAGVSLKNADMTGTDLSRSRFGPHIRLRAERVTWLTADIMETDLTGANLRNAKLDGADFAEYVIVSHSEDLSASVIDPFMDSKQRVAHLQGPGLVGAQLQGANLSNVTGLKAQQLEVAAVDASTQLPWRPGTSPQSREATIEPGS